MVAADNLPSGRRIVGVYLFTSGLFTLAVSLIWGVNTLFLLNAGLDIFQVMIVNAAASAGMVFFEVPTGVVADTVGRKISFLFGIAILFVSTLLYLAAAEYAWDLSAFIGASALLGIGYTFQSGAVDAWLVDALDHVKHEVPREIVFARGGMIFGIAMFVGTLAGGFLGQVDLAWPYVVRAGILVLAFLVTLFMMREIGFEPRPLKASTLGVETRKIAQAGIRYGWRDPVVRPLLMISALQGTFMMYFFYSSQPYALMLLGREDLIWVAGAVTALFGLTSVLGNTMVGGLMKTGWADRPASVLAACSALIALLIAGVGFVGIVAPEDGSVTSFIVMVVLFSAFGVLFGILGPIRQAFINRHIPSAQRATVLSLDSFFDEAGGMIGQPAFGWIAKTFAIPVSYLIGSVFMGAAHPLYTRAGRASKRLAEEKAGQPDTEVLRDKDADAQ